MSIKLDVKEKLLGRDDDEPYDLVLYKKKLKAIGFVNLNAIFNTIFFIGSKAMQQQSIDAANIMLIRSITSLMISTLIVVLARESVTKLTREEFRDISLRSIFGFIANFLMIVATGMLPLSIFTIIQKTCGFFASIFCYYFLRDILHKAEVFALMVGFGGVYVIVQGRDNF